MEEIPTSLQYLHDSSSNIHQTNLSAIPEVDSFIEDSILNNNFSPVDLGSSPTTDLALTPCSIENITTQSDSSPVNIQESSKKHSVSLSYQMPEDMFKIRNLDTGEVIDIRDETKDKFITDFARVVNLDKANYSELEVY